MGPAVFFVVGTTEAFVGLNTGDDDFLGEGDWLVFLVGAATGAFDDLTAGDFVTLSTGDFVAFTAGDLVTLGADVFLGVGASVEIGFLVGFATGAFVAFKVGAGVDKGDFVFLGVGASVGLFVAGVASWIDLLSPLAILSLNESSSASTPLLRTTRLISITTHRRTHPRPDVVLIV